MPEQPLDNTSDVPAPAVGLRVSSGYDATVSARQRDTGRRRDQTAQSRLHAADQRDVIAHARDQAAFTRDEAADARDRKLAQRDAADERDHDARAVTGAEVISLAGAKRAHATRQRASSAEQDARAAEDRHDAAQDREQAACERLHSLVDRELLANALALAAIDPLTGARARAAGLTELDREVDRCRRTGAPLVVAYVDIVGLKALNDSEGHGAGDRLLKGVVRLMERHLRSYDLIIRVGGDEFVCVMSDMTLLAARERFEGLAAALAAAPEAREIRVGLAQLTPDESAEELIARADRQLIDGPHANH